MSMNSEFNSLQNFGSFTKAWGRHKAAISAYARFDNHTAAQARTHVWMTCFVCCSPRPRTAHRLCSDPLYARCSACFSQLLARSSSSSLGHRRSSIARYSQTKMSTEVIAPSYCPHHPPRVIHAIMPLVTPQDDAPQLSNLSCRRFFGTSSHA